MGIEYINQDISTTEGWTEFVQWIQVYLSKAAAEKELPLTDVTLILSENPVTGEPLERPAIHILATVFNAMTELSNDDLKDAFQFMVRNWAIAGRAVASVLTAEVWLSTVTLVDGEPPDITKRPSRDPERQEAICMVVDHKKFGISTHVSMITRVDGKRSLSSWNAMPGNAFDGRFAHFLPTDDIYKNSQLVEYARALVGGSLAYGGGDAPKEREPQ